MSMREQMARAMCERAIEQGSRGKKWKDISEGHRGEWLNLADAVLDVLMQPSEEVLEALHNDTHPSWLGEKSYFAMIRAIKEGK